MSIFRFFLRIFLVYDFTETSLESSVFRFVLFPDQTGLIVCRLPADGAFFQFFSKSLLVRKAIRLFSSATCCSSSLMRVYLFDLALISRPLKASVFDALVIQHESCFVPVKSLETIGTCSAKQKNRIIIGVQTERLGNKSSQSVYPFAKIGLTANEIDFHIIYIWKHFDHDTKDSCSNF